MSVDITKVITHSRKHRDIALNGVIRLEENVENFEGKLDLTESEGVIFNHIANKLQVYNAEFHEHHYRLVDRNDDSRELEAQLRIFNDYDPRMMDLFRRMTNLRLSGKIVTPPPKAAEERVSLKEYNYQPLK